ncbi:MAG: hypothetical protein OQK51_04695 [Kangiellaceae bacterium]|nr:hypothetical protein [Kangiellaceae bacterium]
MKIINPINITDNFSSRPAARRQVEGDFNNGRTTTENSVNQANQSFSLRVIRVRADGVEISELASQSGNRQQRASSQLPPTEQYEQTSAISQQEEIRQAFGSLDIFV